jgi:hypothetical protein
VQNLEGFNNANMLTLADGTPGEMNLYLWGGLGLFRDKMKARLKLMNKDGIVQR